jgi:hypothetical protein
MNSFIFDVLGKRNRRLLILTRWFTRKIDIQHFVEMVMFAPLKIEMTQDKIRLLDCDFLDIEYGWLMKHEKEYIQTMFIQRYTLFEDVQFFKTDGTFLLRKTRKTYQCWQLEQRRELVRDLFMLIMSKKDLDVVPESVILGICQLMKRRDRFLSEVHDALQGRGNIAEVLCVY